MAAEGAEFGVGELARACGVSIRTLRYYDQIGLLAPSRRGPGGHRLYADADVRRLYRICLLRQLGLSLAEIAHGLDKPGWQLSEILATHLTVLDQRLAAGAALRRRLARMVYRPGHGDAPTVAELVDTMREMTMLEDTLQQRIAMLAYDDIPAMQTWLVRVFGLGSGRLAHDQDGHCLHGEVHAGDGLIWLHQAVPQFGLSAPATLGGTTATTAVWVEDVDAHYQHALDQGAEIVYPPTDQPYGVREYSARDPEGGLWSFMKPQD